MINIKKGWMEVLIDTWWNVNSDIIEIIPTDEESFNRYMVECK